MGASPARLSLARAAKKRPLGLLVPLGRGRCGRCAFRALSSLSTAGTMVLGTPCWPSGGSVWRSLPVESAGLLVSGRACEPPRTQAPQGPAGGGLSTAGRAEAPGGGQQRCAGRAGTVATPRLRVRGRWGLGRGRDGYWLCDRESHSRNLQERGGEKRHKSVLQRNRPDHSWKEGKPLNQVLEIEAAGS